MAEGIARVLLFGGSGQLGSQIRRLWTGVELVAPPSAQADVTERSAVEAAIEAAQPQLVVNCTAYNRVDACESDPALALRVNALAPRTIAELCAARGIAFATFSTDYVFDGVSARAYRESDPPNPRTVYGISKLAGEQLVTAACERAYVVRTCGVYGTSVSTSKGYTFIERIVARARAGEPLRVVDDQIVSPSYAAHLANALRELVRTEKYGLYHMANEGAVTWYDFAREALRQAGIEAQIEPVSSAQWGGARRPAFSALENAALHALGITLPAWQAGIAAYLRDMAAARD